MGRDCALVTTRSGADFVCPRLPHAAEAVHVLDFNLAQLLLLPPGRSDVHIANAPCPFMSAITDPAIDQECLERLS